MKYMIASDIHGSSYYCQKLMDAYKYEKPDRLILLGDILYHGPRNPLPRDYNPKEVAELLNKYKNKIIAVRGNCDSEVDQMLIEFPIMSDFSQIVIDNHRFFLTHGHIYNCNNLPNISKGDILCHGHTHVPLAEEYDDIIIFNPGSITFPKENYKKSYGLYDNNMLKIIDFNGDIIKEYKF